MDDVEKFKGMFKLFWTGYATAVGIIAFVGWVIKKEKGDL